MTQVGTYNYGASNTGAGSHAVSNLTGGTPTSLRSKMNDNRAGESSSRHIPWLASLLLAVVPLSASAAWFGEQQDKMGTRVEIQLLDGRMLAGEVGVNRGDDALPYSREELRAKFLDLTGRRLETGGSAVGEAEGRR